MNKFGVRITLCVLTAVVFTVAFSPVAVAEDFDAVIDDGAGEAGPKSKTPGDNQGLGEEGQNLTVSEVETLLAETIPVKPELSTMIPESLTFTSDEKCRATRAKYSCDALQAKRADLVKENFLTCGLHTGIPMKIAQIVEGCVLKGTKEFGRDFVMMPKYIYDGVAHAMPELWAEHKKKKALRAEFLAECDGKPEKKEQYLISLVPFVTADEFNKLKAEKNCDSMEKAAGRIKKIYGFTVLGKQRSELNANFEEMRKARLKNEPFPSFPKNRSLTENEKLYLDFINLEKNAADNVQEWLVQKFGNLHCYNPEFIAQETCKQALNVYTTFFGFGLLGKGVAFAAGRMKDTAKLAKQSKLYLAFLALKNSDKAITQKQFSTMFKVNPEITMEKLKNLKGTLGGVAPVAEDVLIPIRAIAEDGKEIVRMIPAKVERTFKNAKGEEMLEVRFSDPSIKPGGNHVIFQGEIAKANTVETGWTEVVNRILSDVKNKVPMATSYFTFQAVGDINTPQKFMDHIAKISTTAKIENEAEAIALQTKILNLYSEHFPEVGSLLRTDMMVYEGMDGFTHSLRVGANALRIGTSEAEVLGKIQVGNKSFLEIFKGHLGALHDSGKSVAAGRGFRPFQEEANPHIAAAALKETGLNDAGILAVKTILKDGATTMGDLLPFLGVYKKNTLDLYKEFVVGAKNAGMPLKDYWAASSAFFRADSGSYGNFFKELYQWDPKGRLVPLQRELTLKDGKPVAAMRNELLTNPPPTPNPRFVAMEECITAGNCEQALAKFDLEHPVSNDKANPFKGDGRKIFPSK